MPVVDVQVLSVQSSRNQSPDNQYPEVVSEKQGRKRNRKKQKGALDPQEAMNAFIQQLNKKKDEFK